MNIYYSLNSASHDEKIIELSPDVIFVRLKFTNVEAQELSLVDRLNLLVHVIVLRVTNVKNNY